MSTDQERLQRLSDIGAILRNDHFVYTSGLHGDQYVNKDVVFTYPELLDQIAEDLAEAVHGQDIIVQTVIAPEKGAIGLAPFMAMYCGNDDWRRVMRAAYAEKTSDGNFAIRRGFDQVITGHNVLVVEDVVNTGGSVSQVVQVVRSLGGSVVAVAGICNRGGITAQDLDVPAIISWLDVPMKTHLADNCPLCQAGIPINTTVGHGAAYVAEHGQPQRST